MAIGFPAYDVVHETYCDWTRKQLMRATEDDPVAIDRVDFATRLE